ncbi:MAG: ANTAR domain-containing protein [Gammaproteobacteria bacterium]|nr:ANTAR domain-containing protein [Gammaproteobacteria bacterium]
MKSKIMLIDENPSKTGMLTNSLNDAGFKVVGRISCDDDILSGIQICKPDVLVIDMESPNDYIFNQLVEINKEHPKPIVFFSDKGEATVIEKAVKVGVSAFIVDGLTARRVKPVIELAIARFKEMQSLYKELYDTKINLEERKVVERAKGILMNKKNISEDDAYKALRKISMEQNKKLIDVARSMIELSELFG